MESVQVWQTFAFVGGRSESRYTDTIYVFDPYEEEWNPIEEKLSFARKNPAAFLVDDYIFPLCDDRSSLA